MRLNRISPECEENGHPVGKYEVNGSLFSLAVPDGSTAESRVKFS